MSIKRPETGDAAGDILAQRPVPGCQLQCWQASELSTDEEPAEGSVGEEGSGIIHPLAGDLLFTAGGCFFFRRLLVVVVFLSDANADPSRFFMILFSDF